MTDQSIGLTFLPPLAYNQHHSVSDDTGRNVMRRLYSSRLFFLRAYESDILRFIRSLLILQNKYS
jgi:hypothetical protein